MKYFHMIWAGLRRKPLRTVLTLLSVTIAFLLYGVMNGAMAGFNGYLDNVVDQRVLYTLSRTSPGQPLPQAHVEHIRRIAGIDRVTGDNGFDAYFQLPTNSFGGRTMADASQHSIDKKEMIVDDKAIDELQRTRTGMVVGKQLAKRFGWKIGDRVQIHTTTLRKDRSNVWSFDIVGVWERPANSGESADQIWVNADYYDESRAFDPGTVMYITTRVSNPAHADRIAHEIDSLFENSDAETQTQSLAAAIRAELGGIVDLQLMINAVLGAVFFALLFVTGNTMMQSVRERVPEFAVLKTVGFSNVIVSALVLTEVVTLCVVGALVGLLLSSILLLPLIASAFRLDALPMPAHVVALGIVLSSLLALVTGLPPALRAGRVSIVTALVKK